MSPDVVNQDGAGPVVLVTARSFSTGDRDCRAELEAAGCRVISGPSGHDLSELAAALAQAEAWIAGTGPIGPEHLDAAPALRIVARYGIGVDAVDLAAATARGVAVTNTPGANSESVADHTLALILAGLRRITVGDRDVREGRWHALQTRELGSLTVGLIGFGRVGQAVARRLHGFGSRVQAFDPGMSAALIRAAGAEPVSAEELAATSDIVSLHAPGGTTVITEEWFASTGRELTLMVNTARAGLVDEDAVVAALRADRLGVFAADTLSTESQATKSGASGPVSVLQHPELADRVVLTPHRAAQTVEAVDRMGGGAVGSVLDVFAGRLPRNLLNPESVEGSHPQSRRANR